MPVNVSNFRKMRGGGYFFVDNSLVLKTIHQVEHSIFTAPPRFGKTTILSMCSVFFDRNTKKETFETCFSDLRIQKELSEENKLGAQSFYVLKFNLAIDLSEVNLEQLDPLIFFSRQVELSFKNFCTRYGFESSAVTDRDNFKNSFNNLFGKIGDNGLLILIDKYDYMVNKMFFQQGEREKHEADTLTMRLKKISFAKSLLEKFLVYLKELSSEETIKVVITGLLHLSFDGTTGVNYIDDITCSPIMAEEAVGFKEEDCRHAFREMLQYHRKTDWKATYPPIKTLWLIYYRLKRRPIETELVLLAKNFPGKLLLRKIVGYVRAEEDSVIHVLRHFFNGYKFINSKVGMYNPSLCLHLLNGYFNDSNYKKFVEIAKGVQLKGMSQVDEQQLVTELAEKISDNALHFLATYEPELTKELLQLQVDSVLTIPKFSQISFTQERIEEKKKVVYSVMYYLGLITLAEEQSKDLLSITQNITIPNSFVRLNFLKQIESRIIGDDSLFMLFCLFISNPTEQSCQNLLSLCYRDFAPGMGNEDEEKIVSYFKVIVDACKRITKLQLQPKFEFVLAPTKRRMDLLIDTPSSKLIAIEFKRIRENAMSQPTDWFDQKQVRQCKYGTAWNSRLDKNDFWSISHDESGNHLQQPKPCIEVNDVETCALNQLTSYINFLRVSNYAQYKGREVVGYSCVHYGKKYILVKEKKFDSL